MFSFVAIREPIPDPFGIQKVFLVESEHELYLVSLLSHYKADIVYGFHVHKMDFFNNQCWKSMILVIACSW